MFDAVRAEKIAHEVDYAARQLAQAGRLDLTHEFIQHGDVTVYAHVTSVARASLSFAERLGRAGISVDRASLLRGALLHDYFLYDWHDPDPSHRLHGFRHPFFALARAEEDFELTPRERNIIVRHMFPLVPVPPTCREAWIVCLADKWCALRETVAGRLPPARSRHWCSRLPFTGFAVGHGSRQYAPCSTKDASPTADFCWGRVALSMVWAA